MSSLYFGVFILYYPMLSRTKLTLLIRIYPLFRILYTYKHLYSEKTSRRNGNSIHILVFTRDKTEKKRT